MPRSSVGGHPRPSASYIPPTSCGSQGLGLDTFIRGLGRVRGDPGDAQLSQGPADLGRRAGVASKLLLDGQRPWPRLIGDEAEAIAVDGAGDAPRPDDLPKHDEVAVGIFLQAEVRSGDLVGGIVDGAVEDQTWPATLEPIMLTPIPLEEQAGLRHALTPTTEAAPAPRPRAGDAGGAEPAADGGAGDAQVVRLDQMLGEVLVVEAGIAGLRQAHDLALEGGRQAIVGRAAAIAMGQPRRSETSEAGQESPAMA